MRFKRKPKAAKDSRATSNMETVYARSMVESMILDAALTRGCTWHEAEQVYNAMKYDLMSNYATPGAFDARIRELLPDRVHDVYLCPQCGRPWG